MSASAEERARFVWSDQGNVGFFPVGSTEKPEPYDRAYFEKYAGYAETAMGQALTAARVALVAQYLPADEEVVDVGIGCGSFVEARPRTLGFDVNPVAIEWLSSRGRWQNPYTFAAHNMTCWDSLEHIRYPDRLVRNVYRMLFVSLPIFRDREHALTSKHFRPTEHFWFWTPAGFQQQAETWGFEVVAMNHMEEQLGREDIATFVLRRVGRA